MAESTRSTREVLGRALGAAAVGANPNRNLSATMGHSRLRPVGDDDTREDGDTEDEDDLSE